MIDKSKIYRVYFKTKCSAVAWADEQYVNLMNDGFYASDVVYGVENRYYLKIRARTTIKANVKIRNKGERDKPNYDLVTEMKMASRRLREPYSKEVPITMIIRGDYEA